jgi:hypothetical protein
VEQRVLCYDPAQLQHPGDLLHEAGHLAVKSPSDRRLAGVNLGSDPAEEMMAIGWSYAAARCRCSIIPPLAAIWRCRCCHGLA